MAHKKIGLGMLVTALAVMAALLGSCVSSMNDRMMTPQEKAEAPIIGSVRAKFTFHRFLYIRAENRIKQRAYNELMKVAQQQYGSDVDVRHICIEGGPSGWTPVNVVSNLFGFEVIAGGIVMIVTGGLEWYQANGRILVGIGIPIFIGGFAGIGSTQTITATGDVVLLNDADNGAEW